MALMSIIPSPTSLAAESLPGLLSAILILALTIAVYRLTAHPLSRVPGPLVLRVTSLPLLWRSYVGTEATYLTSLFARHGGPILRIGPGEVLIADGAALDPIYSAKGGFAKAPCYRNFDIDGFPSLFSALDRAHRAPRAKSVLPMFSTGALRAEEGLVRGMAKALVARLERGKERGGKVDVLDLARSLAVDVVTGYLFRKSYGGLSGRGTAGEQPAANSASDNVREGDKLTASEFVNTFVAVGRFFFLPTWTFLLLEKAAGWFDTDDTVQSFDTVQAFVDRLVNEADVGDNTYQGRLLKLGLSKAEVAAQMKDLVFAGTDSSGMNLSTFCWQLAKHPDIYAKVKAEVRQAKDENPDYDPASLPYFRACLKETLRLSMANPTRLPRVVPAGGWTFTPSHDFSLGENADSTRSQKSYFLPAGTLVSVQIHTLHHNSAVYADPFEFKPERWLDSRPEQLEKMSRDHIPFSLGSRQCIARNLAMVEFNTACTTILESEVLDGAKNVGEQIEILEWFNSKVRGERIEIEYGDA